MPISGSLTLPSGGLSELDDAPSQIVDPVPSHTELMPYCGLLKIGGHAAQPVPAEADLPPLQFDDEWSLPSSSQESSISTIAPMAHITPVAVSSLGNKKRRREDADDKELELESQPVSPCSRPISMLNLDQLRPIALPKSRRQVSVIEDSGGGMCESEMIDVGDFEEAPFFRPEEWRENWT